MLERCSRGIGTVDDRLFCSPEIGMSTFASPILKPEGNPALATRLSGDTAAVVDRQDGAASSW